MATEKNINTLEKAKFVDNAEGLPAVRVTLSGGMAPDVYDEVNVTYPTSTSEVYAFSLNSNLVATVTVTYTDSTKERLQSAVMS